MTEKITPKQHELYPSRQPLYRLWSYLKRKVKEQGIPMQRSWRKSYERFRDDVGEPPVFTKYRLVLIEPSLGYVWSNVAWIPLKRVLSGRPLRWISFKEKRKELSIWAQEFDMTVSDLERVLERGWSMRKVACAYEKRLREKRAIEAAIKRAGCTVPNPHYDENRDHCRER